MVPELAMSMLACARIGAIHSVVFAGFSADSLRDRIVDCNSTVVMTADIGKRGAKTIQLKKIVDDAVAQASIVTSVLVFNHSAACGGEVGGLDQVAFDPELDVWMHEAMAKVGVTYIYILFNSLFFAIY